MAFIKVPLRSGVSMKLNGGQDSNGKNIIRSVNINGTKANANGDKILNIVEPLADILSLPIMRVEQTEVVSLERDG